RLPTMSPDGKSLAFIRGDGFARVQNPELRLMDPATRRITTLLTDPSRKLFISAMNWTPDGKDLIAAMTDDLSGGNPYWLERISVPGGGRTRLGAAFPYRPHDFGFMR